MENNHYATVYKWPAIFTEILKNSHDEMQDVSSHFESSSREKFDEFDRRLDGHADSLKRIKAFSDMSKLDKYIHEISTLENALRVSKVTLTLTLTLTLENALRVSKVTAATLNAEELKLEP